MCTRVIEPLDLGHCDSMDNPQVSRKQYNGDVCVAKEFTRGDTAISRMSYHDIYVTEAFNVTIHPNYNKVALYLCAENGDPVASSTDIVVSTEDGAVRLGDMFHFATRGKAVVSADLTYIRKSSKDTLRVYLDVDQKSCVVYTTGEDVDLHYHGTRLVSSNFIQPNAGAEDEHADANRSGCTELQDGGLRHIEVIGSLYVDYYIRPVRSDYQYQKKWYSVKQDSKEWFQPPDDVVQINRGCQHPADRGDFTVSRDGASVLIDTSGCVYCTGPGWVHVGNRTGPEEYRVGTVIVID